ncbi:MAG: hypothetical protein HN348_22375 [Proteobacteria bacterium]|jgi:hypothetical protein|nr:hypothetical protein [Pseudomonadota bacterium]
MDPKEAANIPGILLIVSGILNLLYSLIYAIWTGISLAVSGIAAVMSAIAAFDNPDNIAGAIVYALQALSPIIQIIAFVIVFVMALITIFAGLRLRSCRSKGIVWLGALAAPGAPLLAIISSAASLCACNCCGFLLGNIGSFIVLVVGLVAFVMAVMALRNPMVAEAFDNA